VDPGQSIIFRLANPDSFSRTMGDWHAEKGGLPMPYRLRQLFVLSFALVFGLASAAGAVVAQEDVATGGYPVTIHQGDCENPGADVVHDLGTATSRADMEDAEMRGQEETPVYEVDENVGGTFDDLTEASHVILIHESQDNFGTAIACGNIGGADVDGRIIIPLQPVGDDINGVAILNEDDAGFLGLGDDEVNVTVYLFQETMLDDAEGTPIAVPEDDDEMVDEETPTPENGEVIEVPTEATLQYSDEGLNVTELTIPANMDFALTLSNTTENDVEFNMEAADITEQMTAGEVQTITINLDQGEYEFQVNGETGTITALPQADNQG
jgi:hypothetical protein